MGISTFVISLFLVLPLVLFALRIEKRRADWSSAKIAFWAGASLPLVAAIVSLFGAAMMLKGSAGQAEGNGLAFALFLLIAITAATMAILGFLASWLIVARVRQP
jgi:hypothetical protein